MRKTYAVLVDAIKEQRKLNGRSVFFMEYDKGLDMFTETLAERLAREDRRFNKEEFVAVCAQ